MKCGRDTLHPAHENPHRISQTVKFSTHGESSEFGEVRFEVVDDAVDGAGKRHSAHEQHRQDHVREDGREDDRLQEESTDNRSRCCEHILDAAWRFLCTEQMSSSACSLK